MPDAPDTVSRIEANADLVKWCVHILGPDEMIAAASHSDAVRHASELNASVFRRRDTAADDVLCFAYAAPWPWSDDAHAHDLEKPTRTLAKRPT